MTDPRATLPMAGNQHAHKMPFGTRIIDGIVNFQIWAPSARTVAVCLYEGEDKSILPMQASKNGWFELSSERARAGMKYHFVIDGGLYVPDPASRFQPDDVHGASEIIDPAAFNWQDSEW